MAAARKAMSSASTTTSVSCAPDQNRSSPTAPGQPGYSRGERRTEFRSCSALRAASSARASSPI
jgi:hypothetical protein